GRPADHGDAPVTATVLASGLVARTREIEPPPELLDSLAPDGFAWLEDGAGFVTAGIAARVPATDAAAALAGIDVDDFVNQPGTGALAVGALPFDAATPGELVVPACATGLTADGRAWRTEIGPLDTRTPPAPDGDHGRPTRFTVESRVSAAAWR